MRRPARSCPDSVWIAAEDPCRCAAGQVLARGNGFKKCLAPTPPICPAGAVPFRQRCRCRDRTRVRIVGDKRICIARESTLRLAPPAPPRVPAFARRVLRRWQSWFRRWLQFVLGRPK